MLRNTADPEWVADQERRCAINNLPNVGHDSNKGFFSQHQVNVAGVESSDSSDGLDKNMGKAGLAHYDAHDCPQGYTCMFPTSNFEDVECIHPGMFHFLELGMFVRLNNFRLIFFSGLHFHGGSPPRAPPGFVIPDYLTRWMNVLYPNDVLLAGSIPLVIAVSGGGGSRVELQPSARYDPQVAASVSEGPLNYMRDGDAIMSTSSYQIHICRQLAILLETMLAQSPHLELNLESLKTLFNDNLSHIPIDYFKDWDYSPEALAERKEEMLGIAQRFEDRKIDVCLSVPTQLRRLYNSNKLKLVKDDDGELSLCIQEANMQRKKKKQKSKLKFHHVISFCLLTVVLDSYL